MKPRHSAERAQLFALGKTRLLDSTARERVGRIVQLAVAEAGPALGVPGRAQTLIKVAASDDTAEEINISLGGPDVVEGAGGISAVAGILAYRVGGIEHLIEIDWITGTRLNLVASAVRLDAQHEGTGSAVQVRASCGYGIFPSARNAQRTRYFAAGIAAGASSAVPIPPFATSFYVCVTPVGTLGGYTVHALDSTAATIIATWEFPARAYGVGPGSQLESALLPIPLPNDARFIRITNGGTPRTRASLVFQLAI